MAKLAVEKLMDRVILIVDCGDEQEASCVYHILASQILDGKSIHLIISEAEPADAG